ncbi:MAG TPA: class I SAM-dependent methyltransferase [Jiangellaceae bacterium]|nr:class I SAM-dependent methyltransferase [Jiangellaceae bacterium]
MAADSEERYPRGRADIFGEVADVYERSRPGYPPQAVTWLVGPTPRRVLDLGAGTGKLTRALVAAGHDVLAVDPSAPMLDMLRRSLPAVDARKGRAEALPVADADVDVVVAAQAFHWFDLDLALSEVTRVLRPGGRLGLVWNLRDETVPWVAELSRVIGSRDAFPEDVVGSRFTESIRVGPVEAARFSHTQRVDREGLLALVRSRSYVAERPLEQREVILGQVDRLFARHAGDGSLQLPYLTQCYRCEVPQPFAGRAHG